LVVAGAILVEAYRRLWAPPEVLGGPMLASAVVGLAVNLGCAWLLHAHAAMSLNVRGAYLHALSDAPSSVGLVVSAPVVVATGWRATGCSASSTRSSTRGSASTTPRSSSRPRRPPCYASRDPIRYSESPEEAADMRRESRLSMWMAAVAMATGLIGYCGSEVAEGADAKAGAWMGGAGFGFLADTPSGTAF